MVANVQNFPTRSNSIDEVSPTEQLTFTQQPSVTDDSDVFAWRKVESLRFVVQVGFSVLIVGFCLGKLSDLGASPDSSDKAIYWGGLTSIVAWWMPTPGGKGTTQSQK